MHHAEAPPEVSKHEYAQGGYIPSSSGQGVPFIIEPGHTLMSLASYRALKPDMREKLFGTGMVELVLTADEVRELGREGLAKLQKELDERGE